MPLIFNHWIFSNLSHCPAMISPPSHYSGTPMASQLHIFLLPFIAPGHINPMVDFAMILASRGIKSTVLATPSTASHVLPAIQYAQKAGLPIDLFPLHFPSSEAGLAEGQDTLTSLPSPQIPANYFTALELLCHSLHDILKQQPRLPDCIVFDNYLPWTADVANSLNIPSLTFQVIGFFPLCLCDSLQNVTIASHDETILVPGLPHYIEMKRSQLPTSVLTRNEFSRFMELMVEAELKTHGSVVNTFYEMEQDYADHYREVIGRRAWHVGPLSLVNGVGAQEVKPCHEPIMSWLDTHSTETVLYVSFGSLSRLTIQQIIEIGFGLELSGHPFLWVVRDGGAEGVEMRGKGMVVRGWVPQLQILNHAAVRACMMHCGWNSVTEAVGAGVPLITWPMFAEHFYTEELVVGVLGIGVRVGAESWGMTEEEKPVIMRSDIASAVSRVICRGEEGDGIRRQAAQLRKKARKAVDENGSSQVDLAKLIDEIAGWTKC